MLEAYAEKEGMVYLDYFSAMEDGMNGLRKELGEDGVHPNKLGYQVMAPLTEIAIQSALESKSSKQWIILQ